MLVPFAAIALGTRRWTLSTTANTLYSLFIAAFHCKLGWADNICTFKSPAKAKQTGVFDVPWSTAIVSECMTFIFIRIFHHLFISNTYCIRHSPKHRLADIYSLASTRSTNEKHRNPKKGNGNLFEWFFCGGLCSLHPVPKEVFRIGIPGSSFSHTSKVQTKVKSISAHLIYCKSAEPTVHRRLFVLKYSIVINLFEQHRDLVGCNRVGSCHTHTQTHTVATWFVSSDRINCKINCLHIWLNRFFSSTAQENRQRQRRWEGDGRGGHPPHRKQTLARE